MENYGYLLSVKLARMDAEWAREKLQELSEDVPLPGISFEPHGRFGDVNDRTARMALSRIRRREHATEKLTDAMQLLNEFKEIVSRADLNDTAKAAVWMRWGMRMAYTEIAERLNMRTLEAAGLVHEAEDVIRPEIEKL